MKAMNQSHLYKVLTTRFNESDAEEIVKEIASLEDQNIDRLKEVFATKTELHDMELRIINRIDKIYWFILGQTAIMVGLILAIMKLKGL